MGNRRLIVPDIEPFAPGPGIDEPAALDFPACDPLDEATVATLDDATTDYVLAMRTPFEQLRQATAQIAGVLVLAASGARTWTAHPMLALAEDALKAGEDEIRAARVPPAGRHHHQHLTQAARAIATAQAQLRDCATRRREDAIDTALAAVQVAYRELQWSTAALPGFEMVDLSQACCAPHASLRAAAVTQ